MSQYKITCEAKDSENKNIYHRPSYFYCSLCNLTICTTCLIKHLCLIPHTNPNSLIPIEEAIKSNKEKVKTLEKAITKTYKELSIFDLNELLSFISNKKKEINSNFTKMFSLIKQMQSNANNIIEQFANEAQTICVGDSNNIPSSDIIEEYTKLRDEVKRFQSSIESESENVNNFIRKVNELESTINSFIQKIEEEMKKNTVAATMIERSIDIKKKILNLELGVFFSEIDNYFNRNKFNILQFDQIKEEKPKCPNKEISKVNDNIFIKKESDFEYPYKSDLVITLRVSRDKINNEVIIYDTKEKQFHQVILTSENFKDKFAISFPYKFTNIGNNSIIITGGIIDANITNTVYKLRVIKESNTKYDIELTQLQSLHNSRQNHNMIFIPKYNSLLVCCGQSLNSTESLDLSLPEKEWMMLPYTNNPRANATMFLINNTYVYLVGGFSHTDESYIEGYERLNLGKLSEGWVQFDVANLAISTMGVLSLDDNVVLLLGGYKGGKTYLDEGMIVTVDRESNTISKVERKAEMIKRGIIFYSSQQFIKSNGYLVNFDFKGNVVTFHRDIFKFSLGGCAN